MLSKRLKTLFLLLCSLALAIPSAAGAAVIQPYPGAPLCPTHNNTQFHGLWDYARGCHYDHTHNDDPGLGNTVFGSPGSSWGQVLSYPWMTPNENDAHGHPGYKYYVNLNPQPACAAEGYDYLGPVNCVSAFRIQYHDAGGNAHLVKRFHSYYLEARIQKGSTVGTIQTGGWADFGCLHASYKETFLPLPGIDPVQANGQTMCGPGGQSIHSDPYRAPDDTWQEVQGRFHEDNMWTWTSHNRYGYNNLGYFFFRTHDTWGSIDASNPYEEHFLCPDFHCKFNNSEHHVFNVFIMIPASLDTDRDGIVNYTGYTDIKGNIVTNCSAPSASCVPLRIVNAPVGTALWSRNTSTVRPAGDPIRDHDIYFNGQPSGWIQFHGHNGTPAATATPARTQTTVPVNTASPTFTFTPTAINAPASTSTLAVIPSPTMIVLSSPTTAVTSTLPVIPSPTMIVRASATSGGGTVSTPPVVPTTGPNPTLFPPGSISSERGITAGPVSSLGTLRLSGMDDNPAEYVAFKPQGGKYSGYQSFFLPAHIQLSSIVGAVLQVNFKGTAESKQNWVWSIYDWTETKWVRVGNLASRSKEPWALLKFDIPMQPQFISANKEVRIQLRSTNDSGEARIDYEVLQLITGQAASTQPLPQPTATVTATPPAVSSPTATHTHPK